MQYKLGKLPPRHRVMMPALGDFLDKATVWPAVPPAGWEFAVDSSAWGMLGNDKYGCCAEAGIHHLVQAQSANTGNPLHATTELTLDLYSAITGFSRDDPDSDQGTVLTDLLHYIKRHGLTMLDANDKEVAVEIVGSASLDIGSIAQMRYAAYTFGGSYLGINCPEKCEEDLTNWNFAVGLRSAGGHCIPRVGEGSAGGKVVSWGSVIPTSNAFLLGYLDEGYVVLTKAWVNAQGKSPSGLDLDGLLNAMKAF
jgi:hypothetical protein